MCTDIYLDTSRVQTRGTIFWGATSFDIVSFCIIFYDDQCMLKLSSCLHIHTEVCLERICDLHSFRNIEKCPPTPYSSMKSGEHMITHRDDFHEVLTYDIFILMDRDGHIFKYNSLILEFLSETMIYDFTIVLGSDSCEHLPFCFWYS